MPVAYVALGSNQNDPEKQVTLALNALKQLPSTTFLKASQYYQTKPWGYVLQPDFINAVCAVNTELSPQALMQHLQSIEQNQGRIRSGEKNRPRTLDLDLLLYGDLVLDAPDLVIPHPRMHEREFVLRPLAEIAGEICLPGETRNVSDLLSQFSPP